MTSATEDELLDALIWSEDSYSLTEFITEFPLPQVVRVVRGHDGGTDSSTLGYGEVLTIHAVRETRVLSAEDRNGNAISVGLDFPDEVQILPQTKDCCLNSCGVTYFASFYQTVKYVEVIQAHYGTGDNVDSTAVGEILEIVDISKPHKPEKTKVQVRNLENNQKSTLTSTCSAKFRPLLDWKKYKAPELKTHQFGFPVRVRFMDTEVGKDMDYQRLISKSPDINIINEIVDIIVITTTVSSDPVLKFCFEIPKDLEIKVAVAEGFSNGAKHYTDIVTSLNERFDVTRFMASHQPAPIKRRDVVKQYDYDTIKEYIIDKAISPKSDEVEPEIDAPPLPPRTPKSVKKSQSFDIPPTPPPKVLDKNVAKRKNSAPTVETTPLIKSKPAVPSRPRSISQREGVGVEWIPSGNNNTHALSTSVLHSANENPCDPSPPEVKVKPPINIPTPSPNVPQSTNNHPNDPSQAESKVRKPPLKMPRNIPVPSTNVPQTTSNHPNDLLQAELKDIVARKRPMKVPVPPPRPRPQDKTSKHPQANNVNEISKETNLSNKEKEISESEIIQTAEEVPGGTDCTPVTQTTINHPASAILQLPPRPPARDKTSKHSQANNANEISTETNSIFKQKESSQPTNIQSPAKVPGGTDGTTVTQTTIDHPASPISQMDENENAQRPPRVMSPKLPPRDRRPKLEDSASNFKGDIIDEIPRASGQREIESQQMVKDEKTDTQYVPKLPPKSPGRKRRDSDESHYVQPVPLNVPGYQLPQSVVSRTLPHTPPPSRNPPIDRFQRPGTLPNNYKIGGNQPYREQVEENEEIYETPYDPPIMPVAPQMNPRRPQSILNENPYELVAKVPLDLSGLSITEVSDILKNLNMGQYAERFEDEMVDGDLLKELKESDLESFRMESIHRTKLLKFVQGWRPQHITKKHTT